MRRQRPVVGDGLNSLPMKKQTTPSVVLTSPAAVVSGYTLGLDLVKGSVLVVSQLKYILFPGRYFLFRNRAGMV